MSEQYSFDEFVKNVEKLKSTVERLQENSTNTTEENTIFKIINPMFMNVLGYTNDVLDREYQLENRKGKPDQVDLAYVKDGKPLVFIECKNIDCKFSELVSDKNYKQLEDYCQNKIFQYDVKLGILTNGINYCFYAKTNIAKPHELDEESYFNFDITKYTENDLKDLYEHRIDNIENKISSMVELINKQKIAEYIEQLLSNWYNDGDVDDSICKSVFDLAKDSDEYGIYMSKGNKQIFFDSVRLGLKNFVDYNSNKIDESVDLAKQPVSDLVVSDFEVKLKSYKLLENEYNEMLHSYSDVTMKSRSKDYPTLFTMLDLYVQLRNILLKQLANIEIITTYHRFKFSYKQKEIVSLLFRNTKYLLIGLPIEFDSIIGLEDIDFKPVKKGDNRKTKFGKYNGLVLRNLKGFYTDYASNSKDFAVVELKYSSVEQLDDIVALIKQNYDRLSNQ